jgi:predicted Ser/Thr protein kinase
MEDVLIDYVLMKKKNGGYVFKHIVENNKQRKTIHNFSTNDKNDFLNYIKSEVDENVFTYVQCQKEDIDHAFSYSIEGLKC